MCPQDDPFGHLKAIAVDKGGQAILKIANAFQAAQPDMPESAIEELQDGPDGRMDGWTDDDLGSARSTGGCRRCTKESVQEEMIGRKYMNQVTVCSYLAQRLEEVGIRDYFAM